MSVITWPKHENSQTTRVLSINRLLGVSDFWSNYSIVKFLNTDLVAKSIIDHLIESVNLEFLIYLIQCSWNILLGDQVSLQIFRAHTNLVRIYWRYTKYVLTLIYSAEYSQVSVDLSLSFLKLLRIEKFGTGDRPG